MSVGEVRKLLLNSSKYYLDIQLQIEKQDGCNETYIDVKTFKYIIVSALKTMYGDMGYIMPVNILKYNEEEVRAFISVLSRDVSKVWSALSLFSSYKELNCMFRIYKVSPVLACLHINSRIYNHTTKETCDDLLT